MGTSLTQTITIVDDEVPTVKFTNATASIAEDASNRMIDLEISLTGATANPVTVTYATVNGIGVRGATAGQDFTAPTTGSNTADISANQLTGTIQIPILNDAIDEPHEVFTVTISSPQKCCII